MKLYEISEQYQSLLDAIASGEIPDEAIADTLAAVEGEFDDKADNVACAIKSLLSEKEAIKAERDALDERMKLKQHKADKLTEYLKEQMVLSGRLKIETPRNVLKIFKKAPSVEIESDAAFIAFAEENDLKNLLTYKPPVPSKTAIKAILQDGAELPGVQLVSGQRLAIK